MAATCNRRALLVAAFSAALVAAVRVTDDSGAGDVQTEEGSLNFEDYPELCDAEIVAQTCAFLGDESGLVGPNQVQEIMFATRQSIDNLWQNMGLTSDQKLSCSNLCGSVVDTIKRTRECPPASDVGCFLDPEGGTVCDVDVRPAGLIAETRFKTDLPDYHDKDITHTTNESSFKARGSDEDSEEEAVEIEYPLAVAVRRTANLFRIYPATLTTVDQENEDDLSEDSDDLGDAGHEQSTLEGQDCDACAKSNDEDNWPCRYSPACKGCELCKAAEGNSSSFGEFDAPCTLRLSTYSTEDNEEAFKVQASCRDTVHSAKLQITGKADTFFRNAFNGGYRRTIFRGLQRKYGGRTIRFGAATLSGSRFSVSMQLPKYTSSGSGSNSHHSPSHSSPSRPHSGSSGGPRRETWKTKIQRVNVKAIAYVQTALQRFKRKQTEDAMQKWYGRSAYSSSSTRKKLLKILNSVDDMLGNVEYAMGPQCSPSTFAYVYPTANTCSDSQVSSKACTKNRRGQFIFYICQLTLDTHLGEQIETLTHEGSHHATAFTDDVKFNGGTAYGRRTCTQLALKDPKKAIKNADNFCYYVQDVTDGV